MKFQKVQWNMFKKTQKGEKEVHVLEQNMQVFSIYLKALP